MSMPSSRTSISIGMPMMSRISRGTSASIKATPAAPVSVVAGAALADQFERLVEERALGLVVGLRGQLVAPCREAVGREHQAGQLGLPEGIGVRARGVELVAQRRDLHP